MLWSKQWPIGIADLPIYFPRGGKKNTILPDQATNISADLKPGKYLQLTITDSGHGISNEIM